MDEEWRQSYVDKWEVSNLGRVRNKKTQHVLKPYWRKYLMLGDAPPRHRLHRIVALAFLGPAPSDMVDPTVDHIDGDKCNNVAANLRWLSRVENGRKGNKSAWSEATMPLAPTSTHHTNPDSEPRPQLQTPSDTQPHSTNLQGLW
jgi:hypothetical protein